jgi:hypothetical protein
MSTADDAHLDLDGLADVLAREDGSGSATNAHLVGCPECRAALDDLRVAQPLVAAELAALPSVPLPVDIAERLHAALRDAPPDRRSVGEPPAVEGGTVTTLPAARSRSPQRWMPAAAAALVLLAGAGYGASRLGGGGESSSTAASDAGAKAAAPQQLDLTRNSSGTDYTDRASLSAVMPALLGGRLAAADTAKAEAAAPTAPDPSSTAPQRGADTLAAPAPDPLARLRDNAGLADCLVALLPPDDPSVRPLALDYASFRGQPAMVVVLPGADPKKLDVYVVGPTCSQANDSLLFYTSVDRP